MEDDFDFNEFMEDSNRDFEIKLNDYRERMMNLAIEANYENIIKNGINEWHLRHLSDTELTDLGQTFSIMIAHFQELEEYEKCAKILEHQKRIEDILVRR